MQFIQICIQTLYTIGLSSPITVLLLDCYFFGHIEIHEWLWFQDIPPTSSTLCQIKMFFIHLHEFKARITK